MKPLSSIPAFSVVAFAMLVTLQASAQSNSVAQADRLGALSHGQTQIAQPDLAGQRTQIHLAPPVAYNSGGPYADSVAVADLNGDGKADLVATNICQDNACEEDGAVSVLRGNGDGTFQPAVIYSSDAPYSYSVATADLRGDGILDLVVTNTYWEGNYFDGSVSVLLGNGDGTFQPAVSYNSGAQDAASVAIGDLSGNGIPDLAVVNYGGTLGVLMGNGDGTFQPAVTYGSGGEYPCSVGLASLKGDGVLDAVVSNRFNYLGPGKGFHGSVGVLLGDGNGTFQPAVSYLAEGLGPDSWPGIGAGIDSLVVGDINGDGIPDVAVVEWCQTLQHYDTECVGNKDVNVFLGKGDGTFQAPVVYSSDGFIGSALAIADVNGDGRPDLVIANYQVAPYVTEGLVAVLLNQTSYITKTGLTHRPTQRRSIRRSPSRRPSLPLRPSPTEKPLPSTTAKPI